MVMYVFVGKCVWGTCLEMAVVFGTRHTRRWGEMKWCVVVVVRPWRLQSAVSMYSSLRWGSFFQLILRVPGEV